MDAVTRPSLYGSRHPIVTVPKNEKESQIIEYAVVGHCCETGDLFTQKLGGDIDLRPMIKTEIGDYVVIEGVGAYCAGMSCKNYNSYPETQEVLIRNDKTYSLI